MKQTRLLIIYVLLLFAVTHAMFSQNPSNVVFLNTGKMNVAAGGENGVALYVTDAIRMVGDNVEILHNGVTHLGGNFYQDATTNVFKLEDIVTNPNPTTASTGKICFVKDTGSKQRFITASTIASFDRGNYYIAFPHIELSTTDSIILPSKMGIDAKSIKRTTSGQGFVILRSKNDGTNSHDASLRITGTGTSSELVTLGSVIVERDMSLYRGGTQLFAFATPFNNTQNSGYFAGNWVRKPQTDEYGHTQYVLGNKPASAGASMIHADQYVVYPQVKLEASQAYIIKPRPTGFNYQTLIDEHGLGVTGDEPSAYDKGKFRFDGKVYTMTPYDEQLFAEDELFNKTMTSAQSKTINWLIGNSYTAPLSTKLIAKKMEESALTFMPIIYAFPAGSTSYQPLSISGSANSIQVSDLDEIPAMSIFMVRVKKNVSASGSLRLGKTELVHSTIGHNVASPHQPAPAPAPASGSTNMKADNQKEVTNQILFKVSPKDNENIYDLAAIGLREKALVGGGDEYDVFKVSGAGSAFQLATLTGGNKKSKLAANGVPLDIDSVMMQFNPARVINDYKLQASYVETLTSEGAWLKDLQNGSIIDLTQTHEYEFISKPTDDQNRFVIYFNKKDITNKQSNEENNIDAYIKGEKLLVVNLTEEDMNSVVSVYGVNGGLVYANVIANVPRCELPVNLTRGVYLLTIRGQRNKGIKIIKI